MREEYVKDSQKIIEKTQQEVNLELIKSIIKTKKDLENSNINYEFAEGELIDYYLYQIKANQAKLNFLLKKAKQNGIMLDMINEIGIRKLEEQVG